MITYELAKELKDAGFPQEDRHFYYSTHTDPPTRWDVNVLDDLEIPVGHMFAAPTLEELIEACGDSFGHLARNGGFMRYTPHHTPWVAWQVGTNVSTPGATPTEAVARLWLALNPKKI